MRLPIRPPIAAPASPAATRSPVPPPNCEPIKPPATAPTTVPVFSFGPVPVSGLALQAAADSAMSAIAPQWAPERRIDIGKAPVPVVKQTGQPIPDWPQAAAGPSANRAK